MVVKWLVPRVTAVVSAHDFWTPYNQSSVYSVILFEATCIRKVGLCLAVTCHLHFWQNGRDRLRASAVTRGWNGYRSKSEHRKQTPSTGLRHPSWRKMPESDARSVHRKLTLEKKILLPLLWGLWGPVTFRSVGGRGLQTHNDTEEVISD